MAEIGLSQVLADTYAAVRDRPGFTCAEWAKRHRVADNVMQYRLAQLEEKGLLHGRKMGKKRLWYVATAK